MSAKTPVFAKGSQEDKVTEIGQMAGFEPNSAGVRLLSQYPHPHTRVLANVTHKTLSTVPGIC